MRLNSIVCLCCGIFLGVSIPTMLFFDNLLSDDINRPMAIIMVACLFLFFITSMRHVVVSANDKELHDAYNQRSLT